MPRTAVTGATTRSTAKRASPKRRPGARDTLSIRIKAEERGLIDRAAQALGKTRTDFMLEAARRAAEDALLERTVIAASPAAYAEFLARLDAVTLTAPAPLADHHDLIRFACGNASLDEWLRRRASANQASGATRTFVACDGGEVVAPRPA
jgi:uncharacterized protein (DUF1778 family)